MPAGAVDLTGGVTVIEADLARLIEQFVTEESGIRATFEFQFDPNGRISSCQTYTMPIIGAWRALPMPVQAQVCDHLARFGSIKRDPRLVVPFKLGYAALTVRAEREWRPAMPISFVKSPAGIPVDLRYNPANGACWVQSAGFAREFELAICQAWQTQGRPGTGIPRSAGKTRSYKLKVAAQPIPSVVALHWSDEIVNKHQPATWPAVQPDSNQLISSTMAQPRVLLTEDDYPIPALRDALQSRVTVLVQLDANGKPESCAPLSSSNTAYMGNATCKFLLGRIILPAGADRALYARKYWKMAINWQLPN